MTKSVLSPEEKRDRAERVVVVLMGSPGWGWAERKLRASSLINSSIK